MYKITDNFLSPEDFEAIRSLLMGSDFYWHYNDYSIAPDDDYMPQFIHNFIRIAGTQAGIESSQYVSNLNPLFDKIDNLSTILRCKANLTTKDTENNESGMHVDTQKPFTGFTGLLYINDTNGVTRFEGGGSVECKANRFVVFDNKIQHTATTCTDQNRRIVININYTVWDSDEETETK